MVEACGGPSRNNPYYPGGSESPTHMVEFGSIWVDFATDQRQPARLSVCSRLEGQKDGCNKVRSRSLGPVNGNAEISKQIYVVALRGEFEIKEVLIN